MSHDEHCDHDWRLHAERLTGPAPGFEDEPFVSWRTWYCAKCRKLETLQDPSAEEAEAERQANRERERDWRERAFLERHAPEPIKPALPTRQDGGLDDPITRIMFWCLVGAIVIVCLIVIGTQVMPA